MNNTTVSSTLEERIFQLVIEESDQPRETLDRDTALADILDSLGRVELVMAVEDEFELSISDEETDGIITIGQLIDAVTTKLRATPSGENDANTPPSP